MTNPSNEKPDDEIDSFPPPSPPPLSPVVREQLRQLALEQLRQATPEYAARPSLVIQDDDPEFELGSPRYAWDDDPIQVIQDDD